MTLRLYNTLTRKKEPIKKKSLGMYFCGPTVYDYAHIGNFRAYMFSDLLRRYLEFLGHNVKLVMNLTDVDDKTIKGAQKEGIPLSKFTQRYEKAFFGDLDALRIKRANVYPRATEHINEMLEIISVLLKKKIAYVSEDGSIYYNISKFKNYGKLSKLKIKDLKAGARVSQDSYTKDEAQDFTLWKAWMPEDGDVAWHAVLDGKTIKGRPGWHIECSAMSSKHLGKSFDIHGGGIDLLFPHHENEIAQSQGAGHKFVKHWVHCEHLLVDGKKMSKSLDNFYTLRDVLSKGYSALAVRYLLMSAHYRSQLNFTFKELDSAGKTVDNINDFIRRCRDSKGKENRKIIALLKKTESEFVKRMNDDLNVPLALAAIFNMVNHVNKELDTDTAGNLSKVVTFMEKINAVFDFVQEEEELTREEKSLIEQREQARKEKRFSEADRIRNKLRERGIVLEDTESGVRVKKVKK